MKWYEELKYKPEKNIKSHIWYFLLNSHLKYRLKTDVDFNNIAKEVINNNGNFNKLDIELEKAYNNWMEEEKRVNYVFRLHDYADPQITLEQAYHFDLYNLKEILAFVYNKNIY